MEGGIRARTLKGRCVIGSFARVMRGGNVSMEVERFKEQYSSTNMDQRLGHGIEHNSHECVLWK